MASLKKVSVGILLLAAIGIGYVWGTVRSESTAFAQSQASITIGEIVQGNLDPKFPLTNEIRRYELLDDTKKVACYILTAPDNNVAISCVKF